MSHHTSFLALDPSKRSTGWAAYQLGGDKAQLGVWDRVASEATSRGGLYYQFFRELARLRQVFPFTRIYAEEPVNLIPGSVQTQAENIWISVGMGATLELFCEQEGISLHWAHQARWRREFIGKMKRGTKSVDLKQYAIDRCKELGHTPRKSDDAEAFGVLTYGMMLDRVTPPWIATEVLQPMVAAR